MMLRLLCPSGHVLDVDAKLAGRKIRCGGCGKIMLVPGPAKAPPKKPAAGQADGPMVRPPAKPVVKQTAPLAKPVVKQAAPLPNSIAKPPAPPPAKRPTAEPPPATTPNLPREEGMVALPLPPVEQPEPAAMVGQATVARRRIMGFAIPSWLRKLWPPAEKHLPADVTMPGKAEQRIALQLAAVPAVVAVLSVAPVVVSHVNLATAPPWALAAMFLAVLQLVYAAWMINAPDWASARVQMAVCAIVATIYGMLMTLTMVTPANHPLILGLEDVRHLAPAWCGLMLVVMGAATWFCGRISSRWRRGLMPQSQP
jgi:hypothetical protein